jgi:hypothetical protein
MPLNATRTIYFLEEYHSLERDTLADVYQTTRRHIQKTICFIVTAAISQFELLLFLFLMYR